MSSSVTLGLTLFLVGICQGHVAVQTNATQIQPVNPQNVSIADTVPNLAPVSNSSDPCTDFYQYACSQRIESLANKKKLTMYHEVKAFNDQLLHTALNDRTALKSSNSSVVTFLADLYAECTEQQKIYGKNTTLYLETVLELVKKDFTMLTGVSSEESIFAGPTILELLGSEEEDDDSKKLGEWVNLFTRFYSMTGEGSIVDLDMFLDLKNRTRKRLMFDQPSVNPTLENYSLHFIVKKYFNTSTSTILELITFHRLLNLHTNTLTLGHLDKQKAFTLAKLATETNNTVNWTDLINRILVKVDSTGTLTNEDLVYANVPYLKHALKIIVSVPTRVLRNYVTLQYLLYLGTIIQVDDCLLTPKQEKMFTFAYSRVYADAFARSTSREHLNTVRSQATEMISHVKGAFMKMQLDRQGSHSNMRNFFKLILLDYRVAFEDWYMDDLPLDFWYGLVGPDGQVLKQVNVVKGDYVASVRNWIRHWIPVKWATRENFTIDKQWDNPISTINAYYHEVLNDIFIPLGYLAPPIFNLSAPESTNYGIIGSIIGHEIAHGFNRDKSQLFLNQSQCLLKQYSSIYEPRVGQKLNGLRTQNEDIADNSGLKAAYAAYQIRLEEKRAMIGRSKEIVGSDKEFFLGYARRFCDAFKPEDLRRLMKLDSHSLNKYRVNVPLANFEPFGAAFSCPAGSAMNPAEKCQV